jgi:hypothetical protein
MILKGKDILMENSKQWYQSKTVWGALVAIVASLLHVSGMDLDAGGQQQLADSLVAISGAVGGLIALYGRLRADKKLG